MTFSGMPLRINDPDYPRAAVSRTPISMHAVMLNELEEIQGRLSRVLALIEGASDQSIDDKLREDLLRELKEKNHGG